jgi:hypothetical protein
MSEEQQTKFDSYAIVEVMGRQTYAGKVTEQAFGGACLLRVDVPALSEKREPYTDYETVDGLYQRVMKERVLPGTQAFTKFIGIGSIYAMTPCTEAAAVAAAARLRHAPVSVVDIPERIALPVAEVPADDKGDEYDDGGDNDDDGLTDAAVGHARDFLEIPAEGQP